MATRADNCTVNSCLQQISQFDIKTFTITKMQKIVLVTLALVALTIAAPQQQPDPVYILKQEADINPGGYQFHFETSDGTSRQEQGTLKQITEDHKAIEVQGSYKYVAPDGLVYSVTYTADEHGFQPQEHVEHQQ